MSLNRPRRLLTATLLGITLVLSGCGFQLRGTGGGALENVELRELRLSAIDNLGQTHQEVRDMLRSSGVRLSASAPYHLQLLGEQNERSAVSYTTRASPAEFQLTSRLSYQILDRQGRALVGPETLEAQRALVRDRDNVVAGSEEEELLRQEMRRDLSRQLLLRLSSLSSRELQARERELDRAAP